MARGTIDVGGIFVSLGELHEAIAVLENATWIMVRQPLSAANNVLANAPYRLLAQEEDPGWRLRTWEPDSGAGGGSFAKTKPAFLHLLRRLARENEDAPPVGLPASEPSEHITVSGTGAGFGSAEKNKQVEDAAIAKVKNYY